MPINLVTPENVEIPEVLSNEGQQNAEANRSSYNPARPENRSVQADNSHVAVSTNKLSKESSLTHSSNIKSVSDTEISDPHSSNSWKAFQAQASNN